MKEDPSTTPQSLRLLCQQAGKQAAAWNPDAGFSGTTAHAASTRPQQAKRPMRLQIAALVAASSLVTLVVAAQLLADPGAPLSTAAVPPPQTAAPPVVAAAEAAPVTPPVRWQGQQLMVDFDQVPLPQAITALAQATGTTINGLHLLQVPVSVTLHLRTSDVASAWQHLLQSHAGYSLSCSASDCQVWISGEVAAAGATGAAPTPAADRARSGSAGTPAGVSAEEAISQPDGSC